MGTTLTGTTPQDTYDSLIKVTDNGPLSGSLKVLTDGLGNNSTLSLSTAAASIAGTLAVTGNATFDTNTLVVDATNNRVGVGIAVPTTSLDVQAAASAVGSIKLSSAVNTNGAAYLVENAGGGSYFGRNSSTGGAFTGAAYATVVYGGGAYPMGFYTNDTERMRILSDGNVGIGTSTPAQKLTVSRNDAGNVSALIENAFLNQGNLLQFNQNTTSGTVTAYIGHAGDSSGDLKFFNGGSERIAILKAGGLTFNGDTAAANALDDYEEGTWTMGVSFGNASVGVTYSANTGTYTKIGRQVTVNGIVILTSKGSSTGIARITGLPFTIANSASNYCPASLWINNITFLNQYYGVGGINTTTIGLGELTNLGVDSQLTDVDFANNSEIMVNLTYFV